MTHLLVPLADWIRGLAGWRRLLFAFVMGLVSALGFAPLDIFPALLIGYAALVLLLDGAALAKRPLLTAALTGWCFAFGQFFAGLYWIGYAFMVDAAAYAWMLPFALTLLPAFLALYIAAACALAARFWRPGPARLLIFAAFYAAGEWARGHVVTGFPWNLPAYGWGALPGVLQSASVIGAYGLTLLTVLLGASLADLGSRERRAWLAPAICALLFVAIWAGGALRLASDTDQTVAGVRLRIVQPNVPQAEKFARPYIQRNWSRLITLSIQKTDKTPNAIIWPEAAPPFLLAHQSAALDDVSTLSSAGRTLITGAERGEIDADRKVRFHNSVYIFAQAGKLIGTYDKFHLVPFGEYLPAQDFLESLGIMQVVGGRGGFASGDGPHTFDVPGLPPLSPLICYEVIFPAAVVGDKRPQWFVNVTDDSWFGPSSGPYQHLLTARVRAIEEGIPIVRSANTGVSAIIDPYGRVTASLALNHMGVLDGDLPVALAPTFFSRFGDLGFLFMLLICAGAAYWLPSVSRNAAIPPLRH
ncbi:MAG TPA: apolipoprotein N-acyltransferase [Rhizomicrobium sp.]|nr:apolipoprotein N-acyltransferase [Rhizomicrobium sp.]